MHRKDLAWGMAEGELWMRSRSVYHLTNLLDPVVPPSHFLSCKIGITINATTTDNKIYFEDL